ncbi:MAG TPA: hypothetical protein VNS32_14330, partial [Flavisolibacter sp.]|nr:hypothetical protein [Flavisolibacter sp.]
MINQDRRNFLKAGALFSASTLATSMMSFAPSGSAPAIQNRKKDSKDKTRTLGSGKHSIQVAYGMGLGCMGMSYHRSFVPDKKVSIA